MDGRLNRQTGPVAQIYFNHKLIMMHPEAVNNYIVKELQEGAMIGPFLTSPFPQHCMGISPMSTREKKDSTKRRIIVDLSWPPQGDSVNSRIPKDTFMGNPMHLRYPTVDRLCQRANQLGPRALGWKKDVSRAFRQVPLDPICWSLFGIIWYNMLFFDTATVMGCRSAPYTMQSITNVIRHIMRNIQYIIFNYVDDFMGIDLPHPAQQGYVTLGNLLRDLGLQEVQDKVIPPTHVIEFLGILYDLVRMIISVLEDKIKKIKLILTEWETKKDMHVNELQKLAGRLQFAATAIRPGRVYISRIYDTIKDMEQKGLVRIEVTQEVRVDLHWWATYLTEYNGYSIMWMQQKLHADSVLDTDASLMGVRAVLVKEKRFLRAKIPEHVRAHPDFNIAH